MAVAEDRIVGSNSIGSVHYQVGSSFEVGMVNGFGLENNSVRATLDC